MLELNASVVLFLERKDNFQTMENQHCAREMFTSSTHKTISDDGNFIYWFGKFEIDYLEYPSSHLLRKFCICRNCV